MPQGHLIKSDTSSAAMKRSRRLIASALSVECVRKTPEISGCSTDCDTAHTQCCLFDRFLSVVQPLVNRQY